MSDIAQNLKRLRYVALFVVVIPAVLAAGCASQSPPPPQPVAYTPPPPPPPAVPPAWINSLLTAATRCEQATISRLPMPFGTSLAAICRR